MMANHPETHVYLSTGCLHGHHDYCQNNTGAAGTKIPAQCKFCEAPCVCDCHKTAKALAEQNENLRDLLDEARSWARHGYEIGQRSCTWTDHGVAPKWLTEG